MFAKKLLTTVLALVRPQISDSTDQTSTPVVRGNRQEVSLSHKVALPVPAVETAGFEESEIIIPNSTKKTSARKAAARAERRDERRLTRGTNSHGESKAERRAALMAGMFSA
jgi:hypothetical protein